MGNLVGISCGEKDPLGRIALRGKNVPLARDVTERFTTGKMECKTINEQIQNIAQKKDTLCRRMYN